MAHNPLLGNRISLISKKNIRYEGTLYSINEADATVALENVRSYGTEGREKTDPSGCVAFVPPQDAVHPYLLFRGCDIKDLHVHESAPAPPPVDPAILSSSVPPEVAAKQEQQKRENDGGGTSAAPTDGGKAAEGGGQSGSSAHAGDDVSVWDKPQNPQQGQAQEKKQPQQQRGGRNVGGGGGAGSRRQRKSTPAHQVGTGASLLHRKARGAVGSGGPRETPASDFDFESNLAEFDKAKISEGDFDEKEVLNGKEDEQEEGSNAYTKDDFFDSISCDALDKRDGIDNRLRGAAERSLNTETFGAVSLGNGRRGGRRNRRGRGGGRGSGRGRGRGGSRSRSYGSGDNPPPRENNRWRKAPSNSNGVGSSRSFGEGGGPTRAPTAAAGGYR